MESNDFMTQLIDALGNGGAVSVAMLVVAVLILIVSVFSMFVSIYLSIAYVKYNRKKNSANMNGEEAARYILDKNDLQHIKVKTAGSLMFGNSYSHYFKKVRLRRRTIKKDSISSLAMASQKSSLAVLDKEGDPDMQRRVKLIPIITFGPLAFIPLVIIGVALDVFITNSVGSISIICALVGLLFYIFSIMMSISTLKTEKKAQDKAVEILKQNNMVTDDEVEDLRRLFKFYNIEYINNLILSVLETIYYILRIIAMLQGKSGSSKKK